MNDNIKLAKEMLEAAKELMATSDFSKKNTFNKAMGTKLNTTQFKEVSKALTGEDESDDIENAPMEKIADELLAVAHELIGEDN